MSVRNWRERLYQLILSELPHESKISDIRFEGPRIVLYSENPQLLLLKQDLIKKIAKKYHKRISIRSDPSVRVDKSTAEKKIREIVGENANIKNVYFDDITGQVYIEAEKPGIVIGPKGSTRKKITLETKWSPVIIRAPPLDSAIVSYSRKLNEIYARQRLEFLREVGERIHRPYIFRNNRVRLSVLGGGREVGGNAFLIQTRESNILVDAGLRVGRSGAGEIFPNFNTLEFSIDDLDAIIVTHAHLDHSGLVPYLFKYGYRGPVYCTEPTKHLMTLVQRDYVDLAKKEGKLAPYSYSDIDKEILHTITFNYDEVNDITPDIRLTLYNAGHILGSSIVHIHVAEGLHNIVIASDIKYSDTRLLDRAETKFPRVETLLIETTYGGSKDIFPRQEEAEGILIKTILDTIEKGGKILIPVLAVGRAQEIMVVLYHYIKERKMLPEIPIYLAGMLREAVAIHTASPEFLSKRLRDKILYGRDNPFLAEFFLDVRDYNDIYQIVESKQPAVILATNGMLQGGPAVEFLKLMAENEKNTLIFVSYQAVGTAGWNILRGYRTVIFYSEEGEQKIEIKMKVKHIRGFSGHSPYPELMRFIRSINPPPSRIVAIHGEDKKCEFFAHACREKFGLKTIAPRNLDAIRFL
ncbi:MAG: beta-CASP ribonuclease aCPSF1 [Candidatus Njordarchaeia archaeon]